MRTDSRIRSLLLIVLSVILAACASEEKKNPFQTPPPTFTGPLQYRGAVRSVATLRKNKPILVSGFGMVVGLDGTGSGDVPGSMRPKLMDELRKKGLGLRRYNAQNLSPDRFLDSLDTALVVVQGVIPPGAVEGTRFNVMVSAHSTTETTSLRNGTLWTTDLGINGANRNMAAVATRARASGQMYLNPLASAEVKAKKDERLINRSGYVLGGGVVKEERVLWLSMNMPSWKWSGAIADLINERFKREAGSVFKTANAKNDTGIDIRVPKRFANDIDHFLGLIMHLFLDRSHNFVRSKAIDLFYHLERKPSEASSVKLSWEAMGNKVLPVIRKLYGEKIDITIVPDAGEESSEVTIEQKTNLLHVRKAALEVGARLGDKLALPHLIAFADSKEPEFRMESARWLRYFKGNFKAMRTLRKLLQDEKNSIRIMAYEGLSINKDAAIVSRLIGDEEESKFMMDLVNVPGVKPLVYVNQHEVTKMPRFTVFNRASSFQFPMLSKHLSNQLTLLADTPDKPMQVLYQRKDQIANSPWRDIAGKDSRYKQVTGKTVEFHGRLIDFFNPNTNKTRLLNRLSAKAEQADRKLDETLPRLDTASDRYFYALKEWPIATFSRRKTELEDLYDKIVYMRGKKALAKVQGQWQEVIVPTVVRPSVGEEMIPATIPDYIMLMGNRRTYINRLPGFDLSFSEVTETLSEMNQKNNLAAAFHVAPNSLAGRIKQLEDQEKSLNQGDRRDSDFIDLDNEDEGTEKKEGELLPGFPEQAPNAPKNKRSAEAGNNASSSYPTYRRPETDKEDRKNDTRMKGGR